MFELILEIILGFCGTSLRISRNLYLRRGPGSFKPSGLFDFFMASFMVPRVNVDEIGCKSFYVSPLDLCGCPYLPSPPARSLLSLIESRRRGNYNASINSDLTRNTKHAPKAFSRHSGRRRALKEIQLMCHE